MKKETDELNEKILESARSEFLAYGYQDASLRRICRAAGLTTGALYKRYESKDSLFTALLNCAEAGRRNRILTNYRFLSHSLLLCLQEDKV